MNISWWSPITCAVCAVIQFCSDLYHRFDIKISYGPPDRCIAWGTVDMNYRRIRDRRYFYFRTPIFEMAEDRRLYEAYQDRLVPTMDRLVQRTYLWIERSGWRTLHRFPPLDPEIYPWARSGWSEE